MMYERPSESYFIRRTLPITRDYGMYRNWWVRHPRLAGNPISIYLYLLSHDVEFRITPRKAMKDLQLGRTAFTSARKVLEEMDFLRSEIVRHPAGARDELGRSIAGQVARTDFILGDPPEPGGDLPSQDAGFVQQAAPNVPAASADARNLTSADLTPVDPTSDDPAPGFVPLKEDQAQEDQAQEDDDDDARSQPPSVPQEQWPQQTPSHATVQGLITYLGKHAPGLPTEATALERAAIAIMRRAPSPVSDPIAYIAKSILRQPQRWLASDQQPEPPGARHRAGSLAASSSCTGLGHRYIGEWLEICASCGAERPGWRDDRYGTSG